MPHVATAATGRAQRVQLPASVGARRSALLGGDVHDVPAAAASVSRPPGRQAAALRQEGRQGVVRLRRRATSPLTNQHPRRPGIVSPTAAISDFQQVASVTHLCILSRLQRPHTTTNLRILFNRQSRVPQGPRFRGGS